MLRVETVDDIVGLFEQPTVQISVFRDILKPDKGKVSVYIALMLLFHPVTQFRFAWKWKDC